MFKFSLILISTALLYFGSLWGANKHSEMKQLNYPTYEKEWASVVDLEQEGKITSANKEVEKIYKKAKKEDNAPQIYKSLIHLSKYSLILDENSELRVEQLFKSEIEQATAPTKQLLQSELGTLYWYYYQANRFEFYNRTATESGVDESDFRTWDLAKILNEASAYYQKSILPAKELAQFDIQDFEEIIYYSTSDSRDQTKLFQPSFFDFLVNRAIEFYQNDESGLNHPKDQFLINDKKAFGNTKEFIKYKANTTDTSSYILKTIQLYQQVLQQKLRESNTASLLYFDLQRLQFVRSHSTLEEKDKLYEERLQQILKQHKMEPQVSLAGAELAEFYRQRASQYQSELGEDDPYRWDYKEAAAICNQMIDQYPETIGAKQCKSIITTIEKAELDIEFETEVAPHQAVKIRINQRNINQLHFRLIQVDFDTHRKIQETWGENRTKLLLKESPYSTWSISIPNEGDYQAYSFESILNATDFQPNKTSQELGLESGLYYLLTSESEQFNLDNVLTDSHFQVSSISYMSQISQKGNELLFLHRETGQPLSNLNFSIYRIENKMMDKIVSKSTNQHGLSTVPYKNVYYPLILKAELDDEVAYFDYNNMFYSLAPNDWYETAHLFTDRSIYRPGQVVYFKSILTKTNFKESKLLPNKTVTVEFNDANGQLIEEVKLRTNEYGSVQGSFTIPKGRMLGSYYFSINGNYVQYINVEEYKRPKFEVSLEELQGQYIVNNQIQVKGTAIAYAGASISDAQVRYRVSRESRLVYDMPWRRILPYWNTQIQEIAQGSTTTDNEGNFVIPFTAIPDLSIDKKWLPVFTYTIDVEITDINGETRTSTSRVNVGYTTLYIAINADSWNQDQAPEFSIRTTNLNNQALSSKLDVSVFKLNPPEKVVANRKLRPTDKQLIPKETYEILFPNEQYDQSKLKPEQWENGEEVLSESIETDEDGNATITLNNGNLKAGYYRIISNAKDISGQEITKEKIVYLKESFDAPTADQNLLSLQFDKQSYQSGDRAKINIKSALQSPYVWVNVYRDRENIKNELVQLNDGISTIELPINTSDYGGLGVSVAMVKFNQNELISQTLDIPWPDRKLTIETSTFRDKLQPGQEETWSFTIKGEDGEKVAAELVASMYDESLDQFAPNSWNFSPMLRVQNTYNTIYTNNFSLNRSSHYNHGHNTTPIQFPILNQFGFGWYVYHQSRMVKVYADEMDALNRLESPPPMAMDVPEGVAVEVQGNAEYSSNKEAISAGRNREQEMAQSESESLQDELKDPNSLSSVVPRTNFSETAFFYPQLHTDEKGSIQFSFTTPEALTRWKVMTLAHSKSLQVGSWQASTVTQKELMVLPNPPRYFRQGDEIRLSTKISNLTDKQLSGEVELQLFDATTMNPVHAQFLETNSKIAFQVSAKGNTEASWNLSIPDDISAVTYRIIAKTDQFSDGEESSLPILSNRMLVTESLPLMVRSNQTKEYQLTKLAEQNSSSLVNHKITLEVTSNPAWYAVQSLPYLMEYPYECSEQTFNRLYANSLAAHVANGNPKIKAVFDQWRSSQPDALASNLEKNEELKSLLLCETPWVRDAQNEQEQKRRIALLFELNTLKNEKINTVNKLAQLQLSNGAWPWFAGGRENRFITQYIVAGFGHLKALGVDESDDYEQLVEQAIQYLDNELREEFEELKQRDENWKELKSNSYYHAHYFYTRSFFQNIPIQAKNQEAFDFYYSVMKKDWYSNSLYQNALSSLAFHRYGDKELAQKLVTAFRESSITTEEMGMYWKSNTSSWYWYQAPIETQALIIEVFDEVANDQATVDELKVWLLNHKRTNSWSTTKSTAEAVYALLLRGGDWLAVDDLVDVTIGNIMIDPKNIEGAQLEAGTGYLKTSWNKEEITPNFADVTITKTGEGIAWGALYWQYFEDLDKITPHNTPLQLKKSLFVEQNTKTGPKISPISPNQALHIGDKLKVRIELKVDRDMEFVHMKDMRAAGFEPINVLSRYKWQDGLGYYESTKDASTDFFFDFLPKGVYVFEYPLRVNNSGDFSNGITTIQSMYAPEFTSHSEGIRVQVTEKK